MGEARRRAQEIDKLKASPEQTTSHMRALRDAKLKELKNADKYAGVQKTPRLVVQDR